MSGSVIGGVVGAVIGSFIPGVGTQLGYLVGSAIGGYIDPTQVFGPRLTDATQQTAMDGVPRTYGYGTFPTTGNLIWCSELREQRNSDDGKGSPTEQVTYTYYRSYAIAVCEGPADGTGIAGYRLVKRNGKVVFDARTDAELTELGYSADEIAETRAAQSKFLQKVRFYYGVADQAPDPTIQAVKGADNVPGYSYTAYMVVTDDDVTELRGAVPQYDFVVSVCGTRTEQNYDPGVILATGYGAGAADRWAKANEADAPSFTGIPQSSGATLEGGLPVFRNGTFYVVGDLGAASSGNALNTIVPATVDWESNGGPSVVVSGHQGQLTLRPYSSTRPQMFWNYPDPNHYVEFTNQPTTQECTGISYSNGYYYYSVLRSLYRSADLTGDWEKISDGNTQFTSQFWQSRLVRWAQVIDYAGTIYGLVARYTDFSDRTFEVRTSDDGGTVWDGELVSRHRSEVHRPCQISVDEGLVIALTSDGGVWTSANGFSQWIDTGLDGVGNLPDGDWRHLIGTHIKIRNGRVYVKGGQSDVDKMVVSLDGGLTWGSPITLPIGAPQGFDISTADFADLDPIPDAPGYYVDPDTGETFGPGGTTISQCAPTLAEIVEDQCALRGVTTVDVSELEDDDVLGFRIANTSSPQKNIQAAMPGYFFDSSEFDGVQHFVKRGGEDSFHIPFADMCPREPDTIQWERTQEAELLRKVTFTYFDPRATYGVTSQTAERRAGTIQAMGESASQLPIVGSGEWAAQAADITLKAAWAEPDECTFAVSLDWAELVTAAVGTIEDERGTIHRVRIQDIKDDGLQRMITARRTDASAYQSTVGGKPIPLPTFPGSDIRGPVIGAIMNSPVIVDADDRPGIYWAAGGATSGYVGASLQLQRSGQWVELGRILGPSRVGTLVNDLPAHFGDIDTQNIMRVRFSTELESTTFENLLGERNALAILRPDNSVEIVQFQGAAPLPDNEYDLSELIRNRLYTYGDAHAAGARVVFLDGGVSFAELRPEEIGQNLTFRMVSLGTNPDTAPLIPIDMSTMYSQREWPVADLTVVRDGDDFTLTWQPRHRLGSDAFPVRSVNWDGYLVRWQYADQFFEEVITTETVTYNIPGASDIDFTVAQLNRFTGPGVLTTVNIP